jgi:hypothetical protein
MTKAEIIKKIAYLEFVHDQLTAELGYIDDLLKAIGFPNGLESAKIVAQELIDEQRKRKPS